MSGCMEFDYYYGIEAEQFSFYRIPKVLVKDGRFRALSSDAKLLYGLMLDRMSLSMKNGWLDGQNRAYIYYTLENVMEDLGCCRDKCVKILAELDSKKGIGLIEKKRQGLGKPDIIYVKNFATIESEKNMDDTDGTSLDVKLSQQKRNAACLEQDNVMQEEEFFEKEIDEQFIANDVLKEPVKENEPGAGKQTCRSRKNRLVEVCKTDLQKSEKQTSGSRQNRLLGIDGDFIQDFAETESGSWQNRLVEVDKADLQKSEKQTSGSLKNRLLEIGETDLQKSEKQTFGNRKNGLAEVGKADSNYTEWNDIDINDTDVNDIEDSDINTSQTDYEKKEDDYTFFNPINPTNPIYQSGHLDICLPCKESDIRQDDDGRGLDGLNKIVEAEDYMRQVRKNIEYEHFMQYGDMGDRELFEDLYGVICAVVCADCETIRIGSVSYPHKMARDKFLKLNRMHIEYVISCFKKNTGVVYNINEYLKASLFNSVNTMDSYYQQAVQHDMYGGGWAEKGVI